MTGLLGRRVMTGVPVSCGAGPGHGPQRIQLRRVKGWRLPPGAIVVARPAKWSNPFAYRTNRALARMPAAVGTGAWEYEGRISADGMRHDFCHPHGRITVCRVRYMTRAECAETYRHALAGDLTPSMRSAFAGCRVVPVTAEDARRELAGHDLACWCPLPGPGQPDACHGAVLLAIANEMDY